MDQLVKDLVEKHLKDPTTYIGVATWLLTYLPTSVTGITATTWEQVIGGLVGAALIYIDGRAKHV